MLRDRIEDHGRESPVEKESCEFAEKRGWMTVKLEKCNIDSMPDRLFMRRGRVIFIEFKRWGVEATVKQLKRHRDIRAHGVETFVCDTVEDAMEILR